MDDANSEDSASGQIEEIRHLLERAREEWQYEEEILEKVLEVEAQLKKYTPTASLPSSCSSTVTPQCDMAQESTQNSSKKLLALQT